MPYASGYTYPPLAVDPGVGTVPASGAEREPPCGVRRWSSHPGEKISGATLFLSTGKRETPRVRPALCGAGLQNVENVETEGTHLLAEN